MGAGHTVPSLDQFLLPFQMIARGAQRAVTLALYLLFQRVWLADNSRAGTAGSGGGVKPDTTLSE